MFGLLLSSCIQTSHRPTDAAQAGEDIEIIDNSAKIERAERFKSEDAKIIGSLNFFKSEAQWNKDIDSNFAEFRNPDETISSDNPYYKVGNYGFFTAYPGFYNDSCYYVQIRGMLAYHDNYASKIPSQYKAALDLYTAKYGAPDFQTDVPEFYQTPSNGLITLASWEIGPRVISIVLNCDDTKYGIDLIIYRDDVRKRKLAEEQKEQAEATKSDVDKV